MLFGRKKQAQQPQPATMGDPLLEALLTATVRAVSVNQNADFDDNDGTGQAMRNYLDRNARETATKKAHELFYIEHKGIHLHPVFTSEQKMSDWLAKNLFADRKFTALTVMRFEGIKLFRRFSGAPPSVIVVIDPMSSSERFLTAQELQALAQSREPLPPAPA